MRRWLQTVVLVAIAALLANLQCRALCLASGDPPSMQQHHESCHHSSPSNTDQDTGCNHHRAADPVGFAAGPLFAKVSAPQFSAVPEQFSVLSAALSTSSLRSCFTCLSERGSPPEKPFSPRLLFVLRI